MRTLESILDQQPEKADSDVLLAAFITPLSKLMAYSAVRQEWIRGWLNRKWGTEQFSLANEVLKLGNWAGDPDDSRFLDWTDLSKEDRKDLIRNVKEVEITGRRNLNIFLDRGEGGVDIPSKIESKGFKFTVFNVEGDIKNVLLKGANSVAIQSEDWEKVNFKNVRVECGYCDNLTLDWSFRGNRFTKKDVTRLKGLQMDGVKTLILDIGDEDEEIRGEIYKYWEYAERIGDKGSSYVMNPTGREGSPWFMKIVPKSCVSFTIKGEYGTYQFSKDYKFTNDIKHTPSKDGWYLTFIK